LTAMKRTGLTTRYWLATLALTTLIWAAPGRAQSPSTTQNPSTAPQNTAPQNSDDLVRWQLANFNQFLDSHPEVSNDLRKNPSLVDDQQFVENHPALQQYLHDHPEIRADIQQNPRPVMHQEEQYQRAEDRDRDGITRGEVARMDQFLDKHPEIDEQLRKDPKLIDDQKWVANHPELQQFMKSHPEVRQQFDEHPYAFMRDENRYDRWEDRRDGGADQGHLSSFHNFLEGHTSIAAEISRNPTLATNDEYLQNHTELQAYLQANPEVKQQLSQNPQSFIKSAQGTGVTTPGTAPKTTTVPKMPGSDPK